MWIVQGSADVVKENAVVRRLVFGPIKIGWSFVSHRNIDKFLKTVTGTMPGLIDLALFP